jgi:hypothetical protein
VGGIDFRVRFSDYYINRRLPIRGITLEQAIEAVYNSVRTQAQDDGRIRHWGYVDALQRYVRVVVAPDGETIITAFIDSNFRP